MISRVAAFAHAERHAEPGESKQHAAVAQIDAAFAVLGNLRKAGASKRVIFGRRAGVQL